MSINRGFEGYYVFLQANQPQIMHNKLIPRTLTSRCYFIKALLLLLLGKLLWKRAPIFKMKREEE
jgi:hypothetical protein